jgi:hypothetical protein
MASRKQRRRRQKERRHEYEYVYVDEEGHEVDVEPAELESPAARPSRRNGKPANARKSQGGRAVRKVDPPSWNRVIRRAVILAPAIFFALTLLNKKQSAATHLAVTAFYTAIFVPFMYLLDRAMYRTYLKRTGQTPPAATRRR